jgi:hypothetical protein
MTNLECVFDKFPKYNINILLGDFNAKVGREDIFKLTIGNGSLHKICNDNGVRVVNFATSKCLDVSGWKNPQTDHILIDRQWYSSALDV